MTEEIFRYFPSSLRKELEAETSFSMAEELRLRAGKRAMFYAEGEEHILRMRPDRKSPISCLPFPSIPCIPFPMSFGRVFLQWREGSASVWREKQ